MLLNSEFLHVIIVINFGFGERIDSIEDKLHVVSYKGSSQSNLSSQIVADLVLLIYDILLCGNYCTLDPIFDLVF